MPTIPPTPPSSFRPPAGPSARPAIPSEAGFRGLMTLLQETQSEERSRLNPVVREVAEALWLDIENKKLCGLYRTISLQRLVGHLWLINELLGVSVQFEYVRRIETIFDDTSWPYPPGSHADPLPRAFADAVRSLPAEYQVPFAGRLG